MSAVSVIVSLPPIIPNTCPKRTHLHTYIYTPTPPLRCCLQYGCLLLVSSLVYHQYLPQAHTPTHLYIHSNSSLTLLSSVRMSAVSVIVSLPPIIPYTCPKNTHLHTYIYTLTPPLTLLSSVRMSAVSVIVSLPPIIPIPAPSAHTYTPTTIL